MTGPTAREVIAVALQGIVGDPGAEDGDPREHAGQVLAALAAAGWAVVQVAYTEDGWLWRDGDVRDHLPSESVSYEPGYIPDDTAARVSRIVGPWQTMPATPTEDSSGE